MPKTVSQVLEELETRAPSGSAASWDNVGLLAGDPAWRTPGAVVSIDLTSEAIALARRRGFRLIVTHHPCLFPAKGGLAKVPPLVVEALSNRIAVAACHTNFDTCALEVVDRVARGLGIKPIGRLHDGEIKALLDARPEDEAGPKGLIRGFGYGFYGDLGRKTSFPQVARSVRKLFNIDGYWLTDPPPARIRTVGFAAGKGASFVDSAIAARCDLLITGEAGYHVALGAARRGLAVMEIGHRESERFFPEVVTGWIRGTGLTAVATKVRLGGTK